MYNSQEPTPAKRRPVNLTIRADVLEEAKKLNLNASKAAESGIMNAVREIHARKWLEHNKQALRAHNKRVEEQGTLLTPEWSE